MLAEVVSCPERDPVGPLRTEAAGTPSREDYAVCVSDVPAQRIVRACELSFYMATIIICWHNIISATQSIRWKETLTSETLKEKSRDGAGHGGQCPWIRLTGAHLTHFEPDEAVGDGWCCE